MDQRTVKELGKAFGKQRKQKSSLWSKLLNETVKGIPKSKPKKR